MCSERSPKFLDYRNTRGHGWTFYRRDGVLRVVAPDVTPEKDLETIRQAQNLEMRDDDVLIVAYPKCGSHWLWEIVNMVRSGRVEYSQSKKASAVLGMPWSEQADKLPSPRNLNSHLYFRHLPGELVEKRIKTILVMRNPKDVCVSFFNHNRGLKPPFGFEGSFAEFVDLFLDGKVLGGSYFDYIKDWQEVRRDHPQLPFLPLYYEEVKKEPVRTIKKVADFLDAPVSEKLCEEIAEACSFTKLKMIDKNVKQHPKIDTLFKDNSNVIYRKGETGDWKNWLTVAQNEVFDDVIEKEMKETGISFIYE